MNRILLFVLIVPCLLACAPRTVKDDAPASDLDVLVANVRKDGKAVLLPNGREYCAEFAATEDAQDVCLADAEDGLYMANRKLERQVRTVEAYATGERLRRNPCNAFQRAFLKRCRVK